MKDNIYGQEKLRVCDGTLAKKGSRRRGYFRVELKFVQGGEGENKDKIAIHATYPDRTGTEQTLEPGDIDWINVILVAPKSAYEIPRKWKRPNGCSRQGRHSTANILFKKSTSQRTRFSSTRILEERTRRRIFCKRRW